MNLLELVLALVPKLSPRRSTQTELNSRWQTLLSAALLQKTRFYLVQLQVTLIIICPYFKPNFCTPVGKLNAPFLF